MYLFPYFSALLLLTFSLPLFAEGKDDRYEDIETTLVGMLSRPEEGISDPEASIQKNGAIELPKLTRAELIFASLEKMKSYITNDMLLYKSTVVTPELWKDLEFFTNASKMPEKTVVGSLKRTKTILGELTLTRLILDPHTDPSVVKSRQNFIKRLTVDQELFDSLSTAVSKVAAEETNLIAMLRATDLFNQEVILNWYDTFGKIPSPLLRSATLNALHFFSLCMLPFFCYTSYRSGSSAIAGIRSYEEHRNTGLIAVFGLISLLAGYRAFEAIGLLKELSSTATYIQRRLSAVQVLLSQIPTITATEQKAPFPELSCLIKQYTDTDRPQLKPLTNSLSHKAFVPPPGGGTPGLLQNILSNQSVVANALLEAKKVLPIMLNGLILVGYADAYLSLATLLREREGDRKAPYCFVEFVENVHNPTLYAENFYHPAIAPHKVVLNDLFLDSNTHPNNLVISGVNAGGKSTIMKAIAISCVLGQTVGIAPAKRFIFTPFHRINTYMNITDDASKQQSLFRAELARALALLKLVNNLAPTQFSLTLLDEICTGTEAHVGEALAFSVAEKLASYPNSISLLSTHFPGLLDLEQQNPALFKNMKVIVDKDPQGRFLYPYQIQSGPTTQQIAPDLLEQIGLPAVITEKMRDVLNNPHHYMPKKEPS